MTDLEITKLCAKAMGMSKDGPTIEHGFMQVIGPYDPLHDDAQAMVLVKKFGLSIRQFEPNDWGVWVPFHNTAESNCSDLNRAICECVAKMQEKING